MPETEYEFVFRHPNPEEEKTSQEGLFEHTRSLNRPSFQREPFSLLAYSQQKLAGSLIGAMFWNWLYVDLLWIDAERRKSGLGTELMKLAEQKAHGMQLTGIYCWTQSWEAPDFYRKLGYEQFAAFDDFPPGHKRFGFRKYLKERDLK
jgi:GNAT superfamily N-acetyltransferase